MRASRRLLGGSGLSLALTMEEIPPSEENSVYHFELPELPEITPLNRSVY